MVHVAGSSALEVMLTGMGRDGAGGMLAMRQAGARTLAQNEKISMVFGMPREAWKRGGAEKLVAIQDMGREIIEFVEGLKAN
ncbi:MAG: chemotaxis protein CheB [Thermodesulfobacteriota bacterium]